MKLVYIWVLAMVLSMIFLASAVEAVDYIRIEFNQVNDKLLVKQLINFDNESEIQLDIPSDARAVSVNTNYTLDNDLLKARDKNIEISYITNENLEKVKGNYYFVDKLEFGFDVKELEVKFVLDEGFVVNNEDIFPKPVSIETDGRIISIFWKFEDFKKGESIPMFVVLTDINQDFNLYLILAVVFVILIIIYFNIFRRGRMKLVGTEQKKRQRRERKPEIEEHLLESEKAVLDELKKADRHELWQKQLQLATGFSKAKLSRVVRNLEARNLIKKIPFGNTNKIRLK